MEPHLPGAPFLIALTYLGVYVMTGISFGDADVDHDVDADHDVSVEHDLDADHDMDVDRDVDTDSATCAGPWLRSAGRGQRRSRGGHR